MASRQEYIEFVRILEDQEARIQDFMTKGNTINSGVVDVEARRMKKLAADMEALARTMLRSEMEATEHA